jgi:hypothetical protein
MLKEGDTLIKHRPVRGATLIPNNMPRSVSKALAQRSGIRLIDGTILKSMSWREGCSPENRE